MGASGRSRALEFSEQVKAAAFKRQKGKCAFGGEDLLAIIKGTDWFSESTDSSRRMKDFNTLNRVYAHHLIPVQSAAPVGEVADIVRSADNCVYLCYRCHQWVHGDGKTRMGAVAPPDAFTYSHGGCDTVTRRAWVSRMMAYWDSFWDEKLRRHRGGG